MSSLSERQKRCIRASIAARMVSNQVKRRKVCSSQSPFSDPDRQDSANFKGAFSLAFTKTNERADNDNDFSKSAGTGADSEADYESQIEPDTILAVTNAEENEDADDTFTNAYIEETEDADDSLDEYLSESLDECISVSSLEDCQLDFPIDSSMPDDLRTGGVENTQAHERTDLFSGASISKQEFSTALLSIAQKHSVSYSSITDILKIFSLTLPSPNLLPSSSFVLLNESVDYHSSTTIHRCCGFCADTLLDSRCLKAECQLAGFRDSSFVQVSLKAQLQTLFSGDNCCLMNRNAVTVYSMLKYMHTFI